MTTSLTSERAAELVKKITDGLVNLRDETGEFNYILPDGFVLDTKGWLGWEWTQGVALLALTQHYNLDPSSDACKYSHKAAMDWWEAQWKITEGKGAHGKNINTMAPFYSLASFLLDGSVKDERWTKWCEEWAEWDMTEQVRTQEGGFQHVHYLDANVEQLWDDTLFMNALPLAKLGILLNRPECIEEAKYQFNLHIHYLADRTTGLWYHGWQFDHAEDETPKKGHGHNFGKAFWGRGNCWITYAIPVMLSILGEERCPANDPFRRHLTSTLRRQVDALIPLQDEKTGLWHTLLDDPNSYVETSCAAGFAAGIFAGLRMGMLVGDKYRQVAEKALFGSLDQIQPNGDVANVSFGTGVGRDRAFYNTIAITPMPYGSALVLAALVEWQRLQSSN